MRKRQGFFCTTVLLLVCATWLCPAAADFGRPDPGSRGTMEASNQQVRIHLTAEDAGRCLRVTAAGVRTRNSGTPTSGGTIMLPAVPRDVLWAGLYWTILGEMPPVNAVGLNGTLVTPEALPVTASPCWPEAFTFAYFADVTDLVVPGANVVAGLDDSGTLGQAPESEGASLVVVYEDPTSTAVEVVVMDGNDLLASCGQQIDLSLPVTSGDQLSSTLYFIGADGESEPTYVFPDDAQLWNGLILGDDDDFDASDPGAPGATPDLAWDTDGWMVSTGAPNTASITTACAGSGDCVNWVATVFEAGVMQCTMVPIEETTWGQIKTLFR